MKRAHSPDGDSVPKRQRVDDNYGQLITSLSKSKTIRVDCAVLIDDRVEALVDRKRIVVEKGSGIPRGWNVSVSCEHGCEQDGGLFCPHFAAVMRVLTVQVCTDGITV